MKLTKKIKQWQHENIIDDAIAKKIVDYENSHSKSIALWAFGGMGAFAIIVGLVSVIAANWGQVSDEVKLAADLLLCLGLAAALYWNCTKHDDGDAKLWLREVLVVVYYGVVLASMALIGQTYQLGGTVDQLLLLWTLVTLPLVLLARGRFIALLWFVATAITYLLNVNELYDLSRNLSGLDARIIKALILSLYLIGPMVFLLISRSSWLVRERAQVAEQLSRYSWFSIVVMGFMFQFLWYENIGARHFVNDVVIVCCIVTAAIIYFIPKLYSAESSDTHKAMRLVLGVVLVLGVAGVWHDRSNALMGALSNVVYLCVLAWAAIKIRNTYLFNVVTAFICLRILIIYFEVFGSMLQTGIGLIISGVVTLLITWLWFKWSNKLALGFGVSREQLK